MRVVFRVDSSTAIGSGHLMRCLTLAGRLRREKGAKIHFISRDLEGNLHSKITAAEFALHVLPRHALNVTLTGYAAWLTVPQTTDAEETCACMESLPVKPDWLVVDSYALDEIWEKMLRPCVGKIFVIDDLANRRHDCDVLLDQNFYLAMEHRYDGLVPPSCKLLLGPRYALLREEFYEVKKHLRERTGGLRNILVFYGGVDRTNETMKALRALTKAGLKDIVVQVVVGNVNPHKKEVEAFCARYPWMEYACQVNDMAERMNAADLALGAGGTTTWERCFLGLPAIVTAVAENQEKIAEACVEAGYITYIGRAADVAEKCMISALCELTEERLSEQRMCMREMFGDYETAQGTLFA